MAPPNSYFIFAKLCPTFAKAVKMACSAAFRLCCILYFCTSMIHSISSLAPFFVCSFIAIELLLSRRNAAKQCLLLWAVASMVLYACHALYFFHIDAARVWRHVVYTFCNLSIYPLFLFYIGRLTGNVSLTRHPATLSAALVPPVMGGVFLLILPAWMSESEASAFYEHFLYGDFQAELTGAALTASCVTLICRVVNVVQIIIVLTLCYRMLMDYDRKLKFYYADDDAYSLSHIRKLLVLMGVTALASIAANALGVSFFFANKTFLPLVSLLFSALLFLIGYVGRHTEAVQMPEETGEIVSSSNVRHEALKDIMQTLDVWMKQQEAFRKPDLKLQYVAQELSTNRTYLLEALKQEAGQTFSEYVNRLRIDYARQLMKKHPEWDKAHIAELSGYSSRSSFYRNLKIYSKG